MGVGMAACVMALFLVLISPRLISGQHAALQAVAGSTMFALLAMLGARYVLFAVRQRARRSAAATVNVIVFGAGDAGSMLIWRLNREPHSAYRPVAILDDDPAKRRLRIQGVPVLGDRTRMAEVAASTRGHGAGHRDRAGQRDGDQGPHRPGGELRADARRWSRRSASCSPGAHASRACATRGSATCSAAGRCRPTSPRSPGTSPASASWSPARAARSARSCAGSCTASRPAELIMLDRDESALHAVQLTLHGRALLDSDETVLADIRDPRRVREVFEQFRPQIVFHAAALKHLPLLERYPAEAVKSNVFGTRNVLEAAAACGVESFVNISTDKAADPVSVLGYSKRIAERLTAHMAGQAAGTYLSVRFGNVLGSRGLGAHARCPPRCAAGGPVTVTHPEVTRYFMTADEAVQLVLQAAVIGEQRRGAGPRHGRAGAHRRHRPQAGRGGRAPGGHRLHRAAAGREAGRGPARAGRGGPPAASSADPPRAGDAADRRSGSAGLDLTADAGRPARGAGRMRGWLETPAAWRSSLPRQAVRG